MSSDHEKYEAVVVGAGPGGAAAAASLARQGVETLVLERGSDAGSKNVSGGLIYAEESASYTIDDLFPRFRDEASERPITDYYMHNISGKKVKKIDMTSLHEHDTEWSDAVLRRHMDSWLADRVHEMTKETGGGLLTDVCVNGLLRENGRIVGVTCDEVDPIKADLVVAADGVNSELARDAGLMDWEEPEEWFQGVKSVVEMPEDIVNDKFDISPDEGVAHLFAGKLFNNVRGGGFLYTNDDSLSIGTVFHLDSIVDEEEEPQELLNNLLTHPLMGQWLEGHYDEVEYSAKLVPDGKKVAHTSPYKDNLVLVGDAAGQMQAAGPIIKGMNHAVTAGGLVGEAFAEARDKGNVDSVGERYKKKLKKEGMFKKLKPTRYKVASALGENGIMTKVSDGIIKSFLGRKLVGVSGGLIKRAYCSPFMSTMIPDTRTPYATLPQVIAEQLGEEVDYENTVEPKDLATRIGDLTYDTDIGNPHIELVDNSVPASGAAVSACPVSSQDFGGGCYREEEIVTPDGNEERVVSLDTQPCVECGTCAIVADTNWRHPSGGKGVEYKQG